MSDMSPSAHRDERLPRVCAGHFHEPLLARTPDERIADFEEARTLRGQRVEAENFGVQERPDQACRQSVWALPTHAGFEPLCRRVRDVVGAITADAGQAGADRHDQIVVPIGEERRFEDRRRSAERLLHAGVHADAPLRLEIRIVRVGDLEARGRLDPGADAGAQLRPADALARGRARRRTLSG